VTDKQDFAVLHDKDIFSSAVHNRCQPLTERVSSALYWKVKVAGVYCFPVYFLLMSSLKGLLVVLCSHIRPTVVSILANQRNVKPLS
jgi:hypothetical protein